ncbi:MAG: cell division protein FtsK [Micromonosporaceae bacterium]|nr:cell division protein FtsK [Micromonosporaceae bacterium]
MADPLAAPPGDALVVNADARQRRLSAACGVEVTDAETADLDSIDPGAPADSAPDGRGDLYATVTWRRDDQRPPIIPAWMRNRHQRREVAGWLAREASYHLAHQLVCLLTRYIWQVPLYATVGGWRAAVRVGRWASAYDAWTLSQRAATVDDRKDWMALDARRQRQASWRIPLLIFLSVVTLIGLIVGVLLTPVWVPPSLALAVVCGLARVGRPIDQPILVRTTNPTRFTRLTAEMVRNALVSLRITGIKDIGDVDFPPPGVHRDGPGWLARVNLPGGVIAVKVLEKRQELSSALRLPVDQVWPDAGPDHAGQLDLWVGYRPASAMGQPRWSLCADNARTSFFEPFEFGTDQRQRPISTTLFERNFLIGGQPGSGKSYGARAIVAGAALDPQIELIICEFKGTADFGDLAPLTSTYVCGVDDEAFEQAAERVTWLLAECARRGKRIRKAKERGQAPKGKVTPELAAKPGSGLHPIVALFDEVHELFIALPDVGKDMERLVKRGRALGITVILATQIPDKDSLPSGLTRCIAVRWCMSVLDQVANDMILGTGAYKRGLTATGYRPGEDAGWGIMVGLSKPGSVRGQFPSEADWQALIERATQLRGGVVGTGAERPERRDVVNDVTTVWMPNWVGAHWDVLTAALADRWPEVYGQWTPAMTRDALKLAGVETTNVNAVGVDGQRAVRKGCRREAITQAIDERALEAG